jgi:hypothetical protein
VGIDTPVGGYVAAPAVRGKVVVVEDEAPVPVAVIGVKVSVTTTDPEGVPMPAGTVVATEMLMPTLATPAAVLATAVGESDALINVPAFTTVRVAGLAVTV